MTGKKGNLPQAIAIRFVREWETVIPFGDSISFRCESLKSKKQYYVWKRWFLKHESKNWQSDDEFKSFFFYRAKDVEYV